MSESGESVEQEKNERKEGKGERGTDAGSHAESMQDGQRITHAFTVSCSLSLTLCLWASVCGAVASDCDCCNSLIDEIDAYCLCRAS